MQDLNQLRLLIAVLQDSGVVSYKDKDVQLTFAQGVRSVPRIGEVHGEQATTRPEVQGAVLGSEVRTQEGGAQESGEHRPDDLPSPPTESRVPEEVMRLNSLYRHPALGLDLEFRRNG